MNSLKKFIILFVVIVASFFSSHSTFAASEIYFFYGTGCAHCAKVEQYFEKEQIYQKYAIEKKEIYSNRDNAQFFNQLLDAKNIPAADRGVPTIIIGDTILVGDQQIIDQFITEADAHLGLEKHSEYQEEQTAQPQPEPTTQSTSLTLFAVILGSLVDAINPCAFAVLIILMMTILATKKARTALFAGLAFSCSIFLSYLLMGLGLYKALNLGGAANWFFMLVGYLAIILGLLNLKDYFWYGKGVLMEVPLSWRPKLKALIHSVTNPIGAFLIGFLVSLFLLPCTSGPYIVILGMLAKRSFDASALFYLVVYNIIFVSPMIAITLAVYKGFDPQKAEKLRQKNLRILHLIAGLVLLAMGGIILMGWV